jgi:hypothetical protein
MVSVNAVIKTENAVDDRPKNFLTEAEMGNFLKAARKGHHSIRNFAMLLPPRAASERANQHADS